MARKFEYRSIPGRYFWNLDPCEEVRVTARYVRMHNSIPSDLERRFEQYYFEFGRPLASEDLNELNAASKSHGLEPIELRETEVTEYARSPDETKSQYRKQLREVFIKATPEFLAERLEQAEAEEKRLPPAHFTYEQFKLRKQQQDTPPPLGQEGIPRRGSPSLRGDASDVIQIPTRTPPRSQKHENFQRLFPERAAQALEKIHALRNLSSSNYEVDEDEVAKTFDILFGLLEEARATFRRRAKKRSL
jgi:hypothetical protein